MVFRAPRYFLAQLSLYVQVENQFEACRLHRYIPPTLRRLETKLENVREIAFEYRD
jgi:hypothetical protein